MSDTPQPKQLLLIAMSLAAMVSLLALVIRFNDRGRLLDENGNAPSGPDFQVQGLDMHQYGETGELSYQVTSELVTHYPSNDTTELKSPVFTQPGQSGPVMGSADLGVILSSGDTLHLRGNAMLKQSAQVKQPELIARSDYFTYYPDKRFAETEAAVSFTTPGSTMTGTGMTADFNQKVLKLKANVKGTHATN